MNTPTTHAVVTIVTPSHLAAGIVALDSLQCSTEPIARYLFTFGFQSPLAALKSIDAVLAVEDYLTLEELHHLIDRYTPVEASCALKPLIISAVANRGHTHVHYVDADTRFHADAAPLCEALSAADILLTPHYLRPYPRDGRLPHELTLLRGGVFNAGYVGIRRSATADEFLDWWRSRLHLHCFLDPSRGMSGDQRWLDLVPALFPTAVVSRLEGLNVGYWNLHERSLGGTSSRPTANGSPLVLFHYSGFDAGQPTELSVYQNRLSTRDCPILESMLRAYGQELQHADRVVRDSRAFQYHRWWHGSLWWQRRYRERMRRRMIKSTC